MSGLDITPGTKVAALLDAYPDLENELVKVSPAFSKLKNPILRKTIARVTTLQQAAAVGGVRVDEMVNQLRLKAGQAPLDISKDNEELMEIKFDIDLQKIAIRIDARSMLDRGEMPLQYVLEKVTQLKPGEIFELITTFLPAPLIEKVRKKGYDSQSKEENQFFITYFKKRKMDKG